MVKTRYITHTSLGFWSFTRPQLTPEKAVHAAENQVSRALLENRGIVPPSQGSFGIWLRTNHPDIVSESHDYIGEVRQVALLDDDTPRQFRKRYCNVSFHEATTQSNYWGESLA